MPIDYKFIDEGRGILLSGSEVVEGKDLLAIKQRFLQDLAVLKDIAFWLVDFSDVSDLQMSGDELNELISIERQMALSVPNSTVAVAAAADSVYGYARMWEIKAESVGWRTAVFRSVSEAKAWVLSRQETTHERSTSTFQS